MPAPNTSPPASSALERVGAERDKQRQEQQLSCDRDRERAQ
jgi:hypothetical protein